MMFFEFGEVLTSYFTSDDLIHITYASKMFENNAELFFRTFATVWMQDSSTEIFYRPLIEVSFALDQFLSGANPLGYHLSNFGYALIASLALFSIARSLARRFDVAGANLIAFCSALLFSVSPLHTEVVSWLIGRVDGLSTMFYLIAFWLFLKVEQGKTLLNSPAGFLSLAAFVLALLSKEMAASLPFTIFACAAFTSDEQRLSSKMRQSAIAVLPYFVVLLAYFVLRYLATGQVLGGYVGAVGEANVFTIATIVDRVVHFWKIAYPFNEELIERNSGIENAFRAFYVLAGVYLIARLRSGDFGKARLKLTGFLVCWLVIQLLPLYQVFMIHNTLAGSRLFYLSSAVLSIIAAVVLIPDYRSTGKRTLRFIAPGAAFLFMAAIVLSFVVGKLNNRCWLEAAQHVEQMQIEINNAVAILPPDKKLLLAYSPIQVLGAHMFNRYYLVQSLLSPPLLCPDISARVAVLEPRFYTYDHLIPSGPLRRKLGEPEKYQTVYWNVDDRKLVSMRSGDAFAREGAEAELPALQLSQGEHGAVDITAANPVDPALVRFVDVEIENSHPLDDRSKDVIVLGFDRRRKPPKGVDNWVQADLDLSKKVQTVRFPVDQKLAWFLHKEMSKWSINLRDKPNLKVVSARLNDGLDLIPRLKIDGETAQERNDGAYRPLKYPLRFDYDVSNIPGAVSCHFELSRPRSMFQLENFTYRDVQPSKKAMRSWEVDGTMGSVKLDRDLLTEKACYQVRIFARKADGSICGVSSDLIDLGIDDRPAWQPL